MDGNILKIYKPFDTFSVAWAIIAFSLMIAIALLMRKSKLVTKYSVFPLMLMLILCLARIALPFSLKNSIALVISNSTTPVLHMILNGVMDFCRTELFIIADFTVTVEHIIMLVLLTVALVLFGGYIWRCFLSNGQIKRIIATAERYSEAEEILFAADEKSKRANMKVYRTNSVEVPFVHGIFKGDILLPNIEFTEAELRAILLHEWKHFKNLHMLIVILSNIVCYAMWWNPLVYPWRKCVALALEMQCDYDAIARKNKNEASAYVTSIAKVTGCEASARPEDGNELINKELINKEARMAFVEKEEDLNLRLKAMLNYEKPKKTEKIMNAALCVCVVLVFAFSYAVSITRRGRLPEREDYESAQEYEKVFAAKSEEYLQENADDTFSLWVDGQCLTTSVDVDGDLFKHFELAGAVRYYAE